MKLGVCQMDVSKDIEINLNKILHFMHEAKGRGISILGFPEMSLVGYYPELLTNPEINTIVGEKISILLNKCKTLEMGIIIGHPYLDEKGLYNRVSVILPDGRILSYDKRNITELEKSFFIPGSNSLSFEYNKSKFGVLICRDQNNPDFFKELNDLGANVIYICAAHYYKPDEARVKTDKNKAFPLVRAIENNSYVLLSNTVGPLLDMISLGNSLIAHPSGFIIVSAGEYDETILAVSVKY